MILSESDSKQIFCSYIFTSGSCGCSHDVYSACCCVAQTALVETRLHYTDETFAEQIDSTLRSEDHSLAQIGSGPATQRVGSQDDGARVMDM